LAVISASWLSSDEVVRASGRDMVRFTDLWKARRSCLRCAVKDAEGDLRIVLAWERRDCSVSFGVLSGVVGSGGGSDLGVWGSAGSASSEVSFLDALMARIFRPARRSVRSFGAPVAKRTLSGST
jgi:hypothetical protein